MNATKFALQISLTAITGLATTVSVAAFQAATQTNPLVSDKTPTEPQHSVLPQWPYPPDSPPSPPDNGKLHHLPGSTKAFKMNEIYADSAPDWFPDQHPRAPASVIDGKQGAYFACGSCHLMNGFGKPDMQSLNGLSVPYMRQQLEDMKNDLRTSSVPEPGVDHMVLTAKALSDTDAKEALEYFHSIGPAKWIRVVETGTVPKTVLGEHSLAFPDPSGATEPIGNRILELAESYDRTLLRDPTSGYVAYVPPGSLAQGKVLVETGAQGRTVPCIACHGVDLRGRDELSPPIAGRSPTATARQLYDYKTGARRGKNAAIMGPAVEKLTDEDIVDISAYLASLPQ
jgi:cytochrome c553